VSLRFSWFPKMPVDYKAAYERERAIRKEAEQLLEDRSRELYLSMEELKSSQNQLVHSEKMASLGVLAAGIAHEINNPIGYISSNFNSMKNGLKDIQSFISSVSKSIEIAEDLPTIRNSWNKEKQRYDLDFILEDFIDLALETSEGLDRVRQIVSDLRAFTRADSDKKSPVDINDTLRAAVNILENQTRYKAVVETEYADLPQIMGFSGKLSQVFTNLISNANQAVSDNGKIIVRTFETEADIGVSVQDNGCGISHEDLKQLFTPFFTTKPVGEGTGLGLSISHGIIEEHQGKIEVDSELGKGTRFTVKIPLTQVVKDD